MDKMENFINTETIINKMNLCKCGCGQICKFQYVMNHNKRNKPLSDTHRKNIGISLKNNPTLGTKLIGIHLSIEHRQNISKSQIGKPRPRKNPKQIITKNCSWCNKEFNFKYGNRKTCSKSCAISSRNSICNKIKPPHKGKQHSKEYPIIDIEVIDKEKIKPLLEKYNEQIKEITTAFKNSKQ